MIEAVNHEAKDACVWFIIFAFMIAAAFVIAALLKPELFILLGDLWNTITILL